MRKQEATSLMTVHLIVNQNVSTYAVLIVRRQPNCKIETLVILKILQREFIYFTI